MPDPIQGLPPGAELRPIQGLPPGAELRSISGQSDVSLPTEPKQSTREQFQQGFDKATAPSPYSMDSGVMGNAGKFVKNLATGAVGGLLSPIVHPIDTMEMMGAAFNPSAIGTTPIGQKMGASLVPQENETGGQYAGRLGAMGTQAVGAGLGAKGLGMASEGVANFRDPIKAYRSPLIPTEEAQARTITDKLGVPQAAYPQTMKAIQSNLGNLKQGSEAVGGKFKSPLEFGKVASATGQQATDLFKSQLIEPNAEVVTPKGSLGQVYGRITELNNQLRPAYRQGRAGQTMSMLDREQMAKMEAEKNDLTNLMYNTLSERSGLPIEEIQRINKQGASLQNVGDEADASQVLRRQGFSSPGIPFSKTQAISRLIDHLRGGPERVAGRQISRVMRGVEQEPAPLPNPEGIQNYRGMAEQEDLGRTRTLLGRQQENLAASQARKPAGLGPTEPPQATLIEPPKDYAQNFVNKIRQRSGENRANAIPPPEPPTAQNPLDRHLGRARETQEQARLLRKGKQ